MALTTDLLSYWKLDESSGNAADSVGANTLTNTNATYTTGKIANCGVFDGSTAYLSSTNAFDLTSDFTLSAWVYFNGNSAGDHHVISFADGTNSSQIAFFMDDATHIQARRWTGSADRVIGNTAISDSQRYHLMVVKSSGTCEFFIDNVSKGSNTVSATGTSSGWISLGKFGGAAVNYFKGSIDEVGFWDRALTSDERAELYNDGDGLTYPFGALFSTVNDASRIRYRDISGITAVDNVSGVVSGHQYRRIIQVSVNDTHAPNTCEYRWDVDGTPVQPTTVTAGGTFPYEPTYGAAVAAATAFDGNTNTSNQGWITGNTGRVKAYFATPQLFNGFEAFSSWSGGTRGANYNLQYSDNDTDWTTVKNWDYNSTTTTGRYTTTR